MHNLPPPHIICTIVADLVPCCHRTPQLHRFQLSHLSSHRFKTRRTMGDAGAQGRTTLVAIEVMGSCYGLGCHRWEALHAKEESRTIISLMSSLLISINLAISLSLSLVPAQPGSQPRAPHTAGRACRHRSHNKRE